MYCENVKWLVQFVDFLRIFENRGFWRFKISKFFFRFSNIFDDGSICYLTLIFWF